jgi:hypothetical protein
MGAMSSEINYRPNGEIQGDTKDIPMSKGSTDVGYDYGKSMAKSKRGDLNKGYCPEGSITGDTKSDKGFA